LNDLKKTLNIIKNVLIWLLVAVAVFMMIFTIVSVATFDKPDRSLFGLKFFVVQSDSMAATDFSAGDIAIVKNVDPATLQEGDIITFISQNRASLGETVTHKIRKLTADANGNPGFVTYGTTTGSDDETVVTYPYVIGKYTGRIPKLGSFFMFLKTTPGYIVCIFVPIVLLILYNGVNVIRLFRKYKKEQMAEMEEERRKIEEERAQSQKMMEELLSLKAQLNARQGTQEPPAQTPPAPDGGDNEEIK
jgi:signal peptidase